MAAITKPRRPLPINFSRAWLLIAGAVVLEAGLLLLLAQKGFWLLAALLVVTAELWAIRPGVEMTNKARRDYLMERLPSIIIGLSVTLIIAVSLRLITQVAVASLFVLWRVWWQGEHSQSRAGLLNLLFAQGAMFEAIFLFAAVARPGNWLVLVLAWVGAYLSVYAVLTRRGERAAGVLAAAWAVIVVEISWVLLLWLFTYTMSGGYILVPQPALILTALAYCFGSIYLSQREGTLNRARLAEYLLIGLILVGIVVTGTSWHANI